MGYSKNKICGIYSITNIINNKKYIGKSISIKERHSTHLKALITNKHHSFHLQRAFNKYGENNFKFEILAICPEEYLTKLESKIITIFNSDNREYGYNIINRENKKSLESRVKLSNSLKNSKKVKEARLKMWETRPRNKINQYTLEGIFIKTCESSNAAATYLKIVHSAIRKACTQSHGVYSAKNFQFRPYKDNIDNINAYKRRTKYGSN